MKSQIKDFIYKLVHWEFWPYQVIYAPLWPVWLYYAWKCRDLFFYCNANPGIPFGGLTLESKFDIYKQMDPAVFPRTVYSALPLDVVKIDKLALENGLDFPYIVKPDVGLRGLGVFKIKDRDELESVLPKFKHPVLLQEYVKDPLEVGVFYVRMPWEFHGRITGIVSKHFLTVTGDGNKSLLDLIMRNRRARIQLRQLKKEWGKGLHRVPAEGEEVVLVPFGSHTRGAIFQDMSQYITVELTDYVDEVSRSVYGFYFGRLDIKFNDWIDLARGRNLSVIEINGAGSEPTHIYDRGHSIFFAWKEILRHWKYMYRISRYHRDAGYPVLEWEEGMQMLRDHKTLEKYLFSL